MVSTLKRLRPDITVVLGGPEVSHGPIDRPPQLHVYFDDRAGWLDLDDDLPRLGGETGLEPIKPKD